MARKIVNNSRNSEESREDGDVTVKNRVEKPPKYKVLLHNDDYTTMELVISVLTQFFGKSEESAYKIMLSVHNDGIGVCGVYSHEIAETKVYQVTNYAQEHKAPLKCTMEVE